MSTVVLHPALLALDPEDREEVIRRRAENLAADTRRGLLAFPLALAIVVGSAEDSYRLGGFFLASAAILLTSTVFRGVLAWQFKRFFPASPDRWRLLFESSLLISSLAWGIGTGLALVTTGFSTASFLAVTISTAFLAHASSMYAASLRLLSAYIVAMTTPMAVALLVQNEIGAGLPGIGGLCFLTYIWAHGRAQHEATWKSAVDARLLEFRNRELTEAHASLQATRDALEEEVLIRTKDYERVAADLRQSERDYRVIFESVHDAILIFRPEGEVILKVNRRACEIYGYSRDELIGRSVVTFTLEPSRGKRRIAEVLESGGPLAFRTRHRRRDGQEIDVAIIASTLEYRGEPAILSVNRDVTEELRNQELRLAKDTAERANRAKSGFLANMSHEIRTPMAGVIGLSDLMLKTELSQRQRGYAETVRSSALALLEVIDDILDFSKIEAGKLNLERTVVDMADLVERTVEILQPGAAAKGIALQLHLDERLPGHLVAPSSRLRQVLLNLIGNAVKFTEDGEVEVRVDMTAADAELARLAFTVRDTGIGIPQSVLPRLFTPFTQADASTSRRFGGSGLGLAISQQLVALMGGKIEVDTAEGEGTRFHFELTFEVATAPDETTASTYRLGRANARILVAEDNPVNQLVILEQLGALGFYAEAVADGEEVLRAVEAESFDLILMDCQMPGLDGYETTRRLRDSYPERLPIVALTAHAMKGDRERCLDAGMDDYISKPFTEARLEKTLRRWLGQKSPSTPPVVAQ
ncbi:MAG: ATP-binding protein [Acidobacteriota bacterium]